MVLEEEEEEEAEIDEYPEQGCQTVVVVAIYFRLLLLLDNGGGEKGKVLFGKRREEKQIQQRAAAVSLSLWAKRKENQQLVITRKKGESMRFLSTKASPFHSPFLRRKVSLWSLAWRKEVFLCVCSGAIGGG